jgi:hypothetical protein
MSLDARPNLKADKAAGADFPSERDAAGQTWRQGTT